MQINNMICWASKIIVLQVRHTLSNSKVTTWNFFIWSSDNEASLLQLVILHFLFLHSKTYPVKEYLIAQSLLFDIFSDVAVQLCSQERGLIKEPIQPPIPSLWFHHERRTFMANSKLIGDLQNWTSISTFKNWSFVLIQVKDGNGREMEPERKVYVWHYLTLQCSCVLKNAA